MSPADGVNTATGRATATGPVTETAPGRDEAEHALRLLAGDHATLRQDQWVAIEALVVGRRRALVVQRTGWGKSAVYFVATALLRARGAGPTVIVSPLLALMRNQVAAAGRAGIRAVTVNSSNADQWQDVYDDVAAGAVDVLLVSPERLNNPGFRDTVLPRLAATAGMLVVDEAHCISDWGHDFRPDYRRIRTLLAQLPPATPVLATTATANARVVTDVAEQLSATAGGEPTLVLRGGLDRTSLRLSVAQLPGPAHRLAWLADHLPQLPGSGIVYTLTVGATEQVAAFLRGRGIRAAAYSGRTDDAERRQAEDDLLANRSKVLVATSALGMGFDKPDLGFVVHLGAPASPIAYYQQVGRAGRGLDSAEAVLLPGEQDEAIWRYFGSLGFPSEEQVRTTLAQLGDRTLSTAALEARVDLRRARLEMMLKVLDVDGAIRRVSGGWVGTGQAWAYDSDRYARVAADRATEQQAMRDYAATTGCRMEFLRLQLDDPEVTGVGSAPCGRCDRCRDEPLDSRVSPETLAAAQSFLGQPGVPIEARKLWPTGLSDVGLSGRIPVDRQAESGRALARLSDLGWGTRLRILLTGAPGGVPEGSVTDSPVTDSQSTHGRVTDGRVPDDVVAAVVQVLASWDWQRRPTGIVAMPARGRPELVGSLAAELARVGRLPLLATLVRTRDEPTATRSNSAHRLRQVAGSLALPDGVDVSGETLLLVDDVVDTGWTVTEAARLLREAGAAAVLPFALAIDA